MALPEKLFINRPCLPLGLKIGAAAFLLVLVPAYWRTYGPSNFLWFSNLALVLTVIGICLESPLLISAAAVGVFVPEIGWSADLIVRLLKGGPAWGITEYMFDATYPAWVRVLTLYHLLLPPGLWWLTGRLGYNRRAPWLWIPLAVAACVVAFLATDPELNINRVRQFGPLRQGLLPPAVHLGVWMVVLIGVAWMPTHFLFRRARPAANGPESGEKEAQPFAPRGVER